jgi:hypothetical protein
MNDVLIQRMLDKSLYTTPLRIDPDTGGARRFGALPGSQSERVPPASQLAGYRDVGA